MDDSLPIDPDAAALRVDRLTRLLGLGALALLAATWKLWTPQDVFPRVPLFYWAPPRWLDWFSLGIMVAGLIGLLIHRRIPERRLAATLTACGFALQFIADQHRLQPWAWQFFILALVIALADDRTILGGWRWLVISIYAYSALSKFDAAFLSETGPQLLQPLLQTTSYRRPWSLSQVDQILQIVMPYASAMLPIGEAVVAILLAISSLRRLGLFFSWLMHLSLLAILGPLGLNHSWGVFLWNVFFIFQNWNLFAFRLGRPADRLSTRLTANTSSRVAKCVLGAVYLWPALYPWGCCDAWLGWAVYAPLHEEVVALIEVEPLDSSSSMPMELKRSFGRLDFGLGTNLPPFVGTRELVLNHWSLRTVGAPSYPEARFQSAVALALLREGHVTRLELVVKSRPSRWTKLVQTRTRMSSISEIWNYAGTFWFNAYPECVYRRLPGERGDVSPPGD
ncbi:MAG: hypothetical protein SFV23_06500 [Planctomycetaceae bacterium]|nr:hypothetical protein [Planctomycetaceae bacterium]